MQPVAKRHSFLLLGGDAHPLRVRLLLRLWADGLLKHALWSLATPEEGECLNLAGRKILAASSGVELSDAEAFCAQLPKILDRPLEGHKDDSGKHGNYTVTTCSHCVYTHCVQSLRAVTWYRQCIQPLRSVTLCSHCVHAAAMYS